MSTQPVRRRMKGPQRREVIEQAALDVFAERGYHGASIDEIARRSGVTPPVIYDHFGSKVDLHRRLLERTRDELLEMWREYLVTNEPPEVRIPRAIDAWARYVQDHPYAPRMYFHETTGIPEIRAVHDEMQAGARVALGMILGRQMEDADTADQQALEMGAEVIRAGLTGLAIWWTEHPDVPREHVVRVAMNTLWIGLERGLRRESWTRTPIPPP